MINVFYQTEPPDIRKSWVKKIVAIVLQQENSLHEGVISLIFINNSEMKQLNKDFFLKDRPTDVMAFPLEDEDDDTWGEVYISVEKAEEQAGSYAVSFAEEIARLVVHGVLHLHGYDDLEEPGRSKMTAKENHYLKYFISQRIL